jgi:hypothetical protein
VVVGEKNSGCVELQRFPHHDTRMDRGTIHCASEQDLEADELMPVRQEGDSKMLVLLVPKFEECQLL